MRDGVIEVIKKRKMRRGEFECPGLIAGARKFEFVFWGFL